MELKKSSSPDTPNSTMIVGPDLIRTNSELRREIDSLKAENHRLRAELANRHLDGAGPRVLFRAGFKAMLLKGQPKVRRLQELVARQRSKRRNPAATGSQPPIVPAPEVKVLSQHNFQPYKATIRRPVERNRERILHVIANFQTGGSAQLVVDLFEHLGHRFEQEVLTRDAPKPARYAGIPVYHEPHLNEDLVRFHLRRFRPHLLHVHFVAHLRDEWGEADWRWYHQVFKVSEQDQYRVVENVNIPTEPYISRAVDRYVYVSEFVRNKFAQSDAPNITIYPGSDLTFFKRQNVSEVPDDYIGMVYRLQPDKLNENSIDVFIEVVKRRPQTKVVIVGGGYYMSAYRRKAAEAGVKSAFTFTDYVGYRDLPGYIAQMSIFVAPVHSESFGQVSPFAMGMGIPVAGYNVGALGEILGSDELLAPPGDSIRLAEIIAELLDDRQRRIRIGSHNQQRAQELFSVVTMVGDYGQLYEDLLGEKGHYLSVA
jgi:glycosyltransferase involved in cell wall biosynthesis